jgi:hypothetical protein
LLDSEDGEDGSDAEEEGGAGYEGGRLGEGGDEAEARSLARGKRQSLSALRLRALEDAVDSEYSESTASSSSSDEDGDEDEEYDTGANVYAEELRRLQEQAAAMGTDDVDDADVDLDEYDTGNTGDGRQRSLDIRPY